MYKTMNNTFKSLNATMGEAAKQMGITPVFCKKKQYNIQSSLKPCFLDGADGVW